MRVNNENVSNSYIIKLIDEWVHSDRDRQIVKRRWIDGMTYEQLSFEFDLSVSQIKRIIYRNEKVLKKVV